MKRRNGITVVEVIVLASMACVLTTLLLPALQMNRANSRTIQCANNLKQFGLGIHNYHDTFKSLPPGGTPDEDTPKRFSPMLSWQVRVTVFAEQVPLYDRINFRAADATTQIIPKPSEPKALAESHQVPYAMCPSDPGKPFQQGWSKMGTKEAGMDMQEGGVSGLAAMGSYCGNLGSQLTSAEADSRATACDRYNTPSRGLPKNFEREHGSLPHAFRGTLNSVGEPNESKPLETDQISGIFAENLFGPLTLADIKDGTSNTFMVGEVLSMCTGDKTRLGWWHYQDYTGTRASVSAPLNIYSTCVTTAAAAIERSYLHPDCAPIAHGMDQNSASNLTWGYRSWHRGGANFLMGDGSVRFVSEDITYEIYQALGGRDDGRPVVE